jgi:plasmid stabilization system protein ParE
MLPIKVTRRAEGEIARASNWWLANRPAAPEALREDLGRAFDLISRQPGIGSVAMNTKLRGVRRVYLSRVRYFLYYRVTASPEQVEVLALWHASRGKGPAL